MPFEINNAPDGVIISGTGAVLNAVPIGPFDTTKFMNSVVQITGTFVATVIFEGSNDEINPTNWFQILSSNTANGNLATSTNAVGMWYIPGVSKWFRVRVSAYTSGTVNVAVLFSVDQLPSIQNSNQVVSGTVAVSGGSIAIVAKQGSGATAAKVATTASTNATSLKVTAGVISGILLSNTTASAKFLKLYAKASAPVVGTDVPIFTLAVPANGTVDWSSDLGFNVATGIAYAITGGVAEADTTATAANDVVGAILYA